MADTMNIERFSHRKETFNFPTTSSVTVSPVLISLVLCFLLLSCDFSSPAPHQLVQIPTGFPSVPVPDDNPMTSIKVELGRRLFYDTTLSSNFTVSCASCHAPQFAFVDQGKSVSRGVGGEIGFRNSPTAINVCYNPTFFFDGRAQTMEDQAFGAFTGKVEMDADTAVIGERLRANPEYQKLFRQAFGAEPNSWDAIKAITTFERTLISGTSRFDDFRLGNENALTAEERKGHDLFFSEKTNCSKCHMDFNFTDNLFHSVGLHTNYFNDKGRFEITRNVADVGKFKTPSLRNIALTFPYMNDGTLKTLDQVVQHYNEGGKPFINKDTLVKPLNLSPQEIQDVVAFLKTLTDEKFLARENIRKP